MKVHSILFCCLILMITSGCEFSYLEAKRDKSQVIPVSVEDLQALLDSHLLINDTSHLLGELGSDDYSVSSGVWESVRNAVERNAYIWADDIYEGNPGVDWNKGFEKILYCNFVLEGLARIEENNQNKDLINTIRGTAYFLRATTNYQLAQLFCGQYHPQKAKSMHGLPLRVLSDINKKYTRATLEETYEHIENDLFIAVRLLPERVKLNTRPGKCAAYSMLARMFLQKGNYSDSFNYADSALSLNSYLVDFNSIVNPEVNTPFPLYGRDNAEVVFYSSMPGAPLLSLLSVDETLYNSYDSLDIRKQLFFKEGSNSIAYKGHYTGIPAFMFTGISTSELYLIYAETAVRTGNFESGINRFEDLLSKRYTSLQRNIPKGAGTEENLLRYILEERRKELLFRGIRWHDVRRYNEFDHGEIGFKRVLNNKEYILEAGSVKWTWPIPEEAVKIGGILQNER